MKSFSFSFLISLFFVSLLHSTGSAQSGYGSASAYGLRKLVPAYGGKAIQVRRSCDNGLADIGFTSCGDLDTVALKAFVIAANPLSAMTSAAATAYSLRRIKCAYIGSALRLRSSAAGSPTLDIGFTANGDLDTAAIKLFVGVNSAYVVTWFDQSGNGRHASQNAAASQPRIVNAGVIERKGNMPTLRWLGMGCNLATAPFTAYTSSACFNGVAGVSSDVTYNTIVNNSNANYPAPLDLYNGQMVIGNGSGYSFYSYGQTFNSALPLSIWTYQATSGGSYGFYYNGSLTGSGVVSSTFGDTGNPLVLGSRADGQTGLNGWISEILTFDALPSATDRQFLEWSQSQYYSTGGPVLSTLPASPASAWVSAWYDQSGNSRHAIQALSLSQPSIINAGSIDKNNSNPAISFAGFPQNLAAPLSTNVYPVSLSLLGNTSGNTAAGAFVKLGTDLSLTQGGIAIGIGSPGGTFLSPGTSVIGLKEFVDWCPSAPNVNYPSNPFTSTTIQQSGGMMNTYLNGAAIPLSNSASAVGATISGSLLIGGYVNAINLYAPVKTSELIVFAQALSNTQRTLLETGQAAYNSVAITNSKYTPPAAGSYFRYVNGVGRESAADSISETRSSVGMCFKIGQAPADFLKDNGDYLTAGINCPMAAALSSLNLPGTIVQRWSNDWYVNKTDVSANNGNIQFYFDFSDYGFSPSPGPGVASDYELLVRNSSSGTFSIVAGTTKSVAGDRIFFTIDAASIPTNYYYTVGTKNTSTGPLPVELASFDARCVNGKVEVNWITATQTNNDHFSIDRAADGINFQTLGIRKGAGTTYKRLSYSFTDNEPLDGIAYYRLKQTDRDGSEKNAPPVAVSCGDDAPGIRIFPNPGNGLLNIEGIPPGAQIRVYTPAGALVFQQQNVSSFQRIDLTNLTAGLYFIKLDDTDQQPVKKFVIVH